MTWPRISRSPRMPPSTCAEQPLAVMWLRPRRVPRTSSCSAVALSSSTPKTGLWTPPPKAARCCRRSTVSEAHGYVADTDSYLPSVSRSRPPPRKKVPPFVVSEPAQSLPSPMRTCGTSLGPLTKTFSPAREPRNTSEDRACPFAIRKYHRSRRPCQREVSSSKSRVRVAWLNDQAVVSAAASVTLTVFLPPPTARDRAWSSPRSVTRSSPWPVVTMSGLAAPSAPDMTWSFPPPVAMSSRSVSASGS